MRVWPGPASAHSSAQGCRRLAILSPSTPPDADEPGNTHVQLCSRALAELGYVDGQNIPFEFRFANHALERLPDLAAELVAGQPDVLYTWYLRRRAGCGGRHLDDPDRGRAGR